jgi:hypothetical protein
MKIANLLAVGIIAAPAGLGVPIAEDELSAAGMAGARLAFYGDGSLRYTLEPATARH